MWMAVNDNCEAKKGKETGMDEKVIAAVRAKVNAIMGEYPMFAY